MFYANELTDGPKAHSTLAANFARVLHGIVAQSYHDDGQRRHYIESATEAQARLHYFEIDGVRESTRRCSKVVKAHADVFFAKIFPALQEYFGDTTATRLKIICGHGASVSALFREDIGLADSNRFITTRNTSWLSNAGRTSRAPGIPM